MVISPIFDLVYISFSSDIETRNHGPAISRLGKLFRHWPLKDPDSLGARVLLCVMLLELVVYLLEIASSIVAEAESTVALGFYNPLEVIHRSLCFPPWELLHISLTCNIHAFDKRPLSTI